MMEEGKESANVQEQDEDDKSGKKTSIPKQRSLLSFAGFTKKVVMNEESDESVKIKEVSRARSLILCNDCGNSFDNKGALYMHRLHKHKTDDKFEREGEREQVSEVEEESGDDCENEELPDANEVRTYHR